MAEYRRPVRIDEGEELEYARAVVRHFHEDRTDAELEPWVPLVRGDDYRAWVVREGEDVVATFGVYAMSVSLPGGGRLRAAGVTAVGCAQTHRRRGLLRSMMAAGLDEAVEHDEPVALLYASESAIYGRFGFGAVAPSLVHRIDRGVDFRHPVDPTLVRGVHPEEAAGSWPAVFEQLRDQRGGCLSRNEHMWRLALVEDPPSGRDGASGRRLAHVPRRGYVAYRVKPDEGLHPRGEVRVEELVATDAEAEAALWQHVCDIDLTTTVTAWVRPPDDVLPLLLVDPLRAHTSVGPPLYARLLDVVAALSARAYATAGEIVLAVEDPIRDQTGTYRLRAHPEGGEVARVDTEPELTLPIDVLASIWLGGVSATRLRAARHLREHVPGAAERLDRLTAVDRLPWTPFDF